MHYCDFCGKKVLGDSKYCRYCGNRLEDKFSDTQPLPVIREPIIGVPAPNKGYFSSNSNIFMKHIREFRIKKYAVLSYLASFITTVGLIYVLATFKTVDEYQLLTATVGFLLVLYFWRSAH